MGFKIKDVAIIDNFVCYSLRSGLLDKLRRRNNQLLFLSYSVFGDDVYPVYARAKVGGMDHARKIG